MTKQRQDIIITNNALVARYYSGEFDAILLKDDISQVLVYARNLIHLGHKLLSHPLSGSIKPNENPFKSILLSGNSSGLDLESLQIIENCILMLNNFPIKYKEMPLSWRNDFEKIDLELIKGAIDNYRLNRR